MNRKEGHARAGRIVEWSGVEWNSGVQCGVCIIVQCSGVERGGVEQRSGAALMELPQAPLRSMHSFVPAFVRSFVRFVRSFVGVW